MTFERKLAYKRVIRRHLDRGVTRRNVAEAINALRDGTTPAELDDMLSDYPVHR